MKNKLVLLLILVVISLIGLTYWQYEDIGVKDVDSRFRGNDNAERGNDNAERGNDNGRFPLSRERHETATKIPIIMYHYVREVDKNADLLGWNLSINPIDFEKQLKYLHEQGYKSVHLEELLDGKAPEKSVVLSFDDGLEDFYTTALPILQKYGFTASNAVITGMIGSHEHMDEAQINGVIAAGVEITAHSINHLNLANLSEEQVRREVAQSKKYLEENFGMEVSGFVYPSGKYNDIVLKVLAEEGYKIALTTEYGEADLEEDNFFLLPRVRVDNRDGYYGFVKKVESFE